MTSTANQRQLYLFLGAVLLLSMAVGVNEVIFNNFLDDTFSITAQQRGALEFPRELPGLLVVGMTGVLCMLAVTHLGIVGAIALSVGLVGLAVWGHSYPAMVGMMVVASSGMHLLMPVNSALALGLGSETTRGRRMGLMGALGTVGTLLGTGAVWYVFSEEHTPYAVAFLAIAGVAGATGIVYACMHVPHLHQPRARFVFRRKYSLYYVLELLFGARKQIFITFGPWVLIQIYDQPASRIASLFFIAGVIGIFFKPLAGMAVDHFGERVVLIADGLVLALVCLGYGYSEALTGDSVLACRFACACFVADNLLFALGTGRAVYLSRLTPNPRELTSSLAMGISINHLISMCVPLVAGVIWAKLGYQHVFLGAAMLALVIAVVASRVPAKGYAYQDQE